MITKASTPWWHAPIYVILAGCAVSFLGFGVRSILGLFLEPMTTANGWTRETFSIAMAIQNLLWGLGLPIAGILVDKNGPRGVLIFGALAYFLGLVGMAYSADSFTLHLTAGVIAGSGVAFTAFTLMLATMVKVTGPERRSFVLGLGTAAGSLGQVVFSPISQGLISSYGWHSALIILACLLLTLIPLALILPSQANNSATQIDEKQSLAEVLYEALHHKGYLLLTTGFFVCGFHVAFITVHLPAYVRDLGLDPKVGAHSIALIGLFNILGSVLSGLAGQRYSKKMGLATIYALRAIAIFALIMAPKTALTIYLFAGTMGILWLSTVPLTTGIVAQIFGVRYMATLFGVVFLSHQLGSFSGIWLGGWLYDHHGNYDMMWWAGIALGLLAAFVHIPINEKPLSRLGEIS